MAKRKPHYLKGSKGSETPSRLLFLDCETSAAGDDGHCEVGDHKLRLAVTSYLRFDPARKSVGRQVLHTTSESVWEEIFSRTAKRTPLWVFAHNANFDLTVIGFWDLCEELRLKIDFAITEPDLFLVKCSSNRGRIVFCDTRNIWKSSLADIGKAHGLEKLPMPEMEAPEDEWADYCVRDVEVIERAVTEHMRVIGREKYGTFKPSAAGQAFTTFKARFNCSSILIHDDDDANLLERMSYYGGRCECFYRGKVGGLTAEEMSKVRRDLFPGAEGTPSAIHLLDVNSLYPSVMRGRKYPVKLIGSYERCSAGDLADHIDDYGVVASVRLRDTSHRYPIRNGKETHYSGIGGWTVLAGPELRFAMVKGHIIGMGRCCVYETAEIFTEYVDHFYEMKTIARSSGDLAREETAKMFLNSLYGKFGQRSARWIDKPDLEFPITWGTYVSPDRDTGLPAIYRVFAGHAQQRVDSGESRESFPAISAWVTSYARLRMVDLYEVAGAQQVFYHDTDSLHVSPVGFDRLAAAGEISSTEIGKLRQAEVAHTAVYRGAKNYTFGGRHVISGIKPTPLAVLPRKVDQLEFQGVLSTIQKNPNRSIRVSVKSVEIPNWDIDQHPEKWGFSSPM